MADHDDNDQIVPDDAHRDPEFQATLSRIFEEAVASGTLNEPQSGDQAEEFVDESGAFFIGREFTLGAFARWFKKQRLGSLPFNAVGYHHTWNPSPEIWAGISTLNGIFNYYHNVRGWSEGMGPHLFVYSGDGPYSPGSPRIYVGTHPAHDGAGILGRNGRWLHIEHVWDGDSRPFSEAMKRVSGKVLGIVCATHPHAPRTIPLTFIRDGGVDNPSQPLGIMYHRDQNPSWTPGAWPKSCPGLKVTHENLDAQVIAIAGGQVADAEPDALQTPQPVAGPLRDQVIGGRQFIVCERSLRTVQDDVPCRLFADPGSPRVHASLAKGAEVKAQYIVRGDDDQLWFVTDAGWRVPASGFIP